MKSDPHIRSRDNWRRAICGAPMLADQMSSRGCLKCEHLGRIFQQAGLIVIDPPVWRDA